MQLGESFPREFLENQTKRYLLTGAVVRVWTEKTTPSKWKWFLILSLNPFRCFIINSEIPLYYQKTARFALDLQIELKQSDHPFLEKNNCWLDCLNYFEEYSYEEVFEKCCERTAQIKGNLNQETINLIMEAIQENDTLSQIEKNLFISSLPN